MHTCAIALLALGAVVWAQDSDRGNLSVAGLGERKQALLDAGGDTKDMALAMLETETMTTDYAYGDNKVDDAANFGLFKQNWGMLRQCASQFQGQSEAEFNNGAVLNEDIAADITARHECDEYYGYDTWFAGHRNGEAGLANPNTDDIALYKGAIEWIQQQIDSDPTYQTDDTRFWVDVVAI